MGLFVAMKLKPGSFDCQREYSLRMGQPILIFLARLGRLTRSGLHGDCLIVEKTKACALHGIDNLALSWLDLFLLDVYLLLQNVHSRQILYS